MMREFTLVKKRRHTNQQVSIYAILTPEEHCTMTICLYIKWTGLGKET